VSARQDPQPGSRCLSAATTFAEIWRSAQARERDVQLSRGEFQGPLYGFPHAVQDFLPVKGIAMTMGSPILKDFVPTADSVVVARLRAAGAIFIGKPGAASGERAQIHYPVKNRTSQSR
jgi:Asp-tRNA(Asn)/Glu-tRNA(Gln) amidotransferase A subunit family amidase